CVARALDDAKQRWDQERPRRTHYNPLMVLAGDVGGTKTLLGLFEPSARRPISKATRSYETTAYSSFLEILDAFLSDVPPSTPLRAAAFGVAGPVVHDRAKLTNIGWTISASDIRSHLGTPHVELLNDLAAMARSIEVLTPDELLVLQEGTLDDQSSAAVIAAGTGMGQAFLHRRNGRLVPAASEGGHADFAARTDRELELVRMLRDREGRAGGKEFLGGPGLFTLHRFTPRGGECEIVTALDSPDAPAAVSRAGLGGRCQGCAEALRMCGRRCGHPGAPRSGAWRRVHRRRDRAEDPACNPGWRIHAGIPRQGADDRHVDQSAGESDLERRVRAYRRRGTRKRACAMTAAPRVDSPSDRADDDEAAQGDGF